MMAIVSVIFFTGCPSKEPETIDLGTIPEKYLPTVPYEDGQTFYLQHESDRMLIPFHVTRHRVSSQVSNGFVDFDYMRIKPAPSVYYNYEVDVTTCKPEYPLFDIDIHFSNGYMADSLYDPNSDPRFFKYAYLTCMNLYATFPFIGENTEQFTMHDFLVVDGHIYNNVFQFDNESQDLEGINIKTLFYSYEKGVIAVLMSNHEKYVLYEEE